MGQKPWDKGKDRAPPRLSEDGRARAAEREERRARALRDNLKKRKAQRRGRAAAPAEQAESPDAAGPDGAGRTR